MALVRRPDGTLYAVAGATRSGKTLWTAQAVRAWRRLLVWDLKGEWSTRYRCQRVASIQALAEHCKPGALPHRIAYHRAGMVEDFEPFCRLAWVWVRVARGALVIEELSSVTHPGKAPPAWGDIVRQGLGFGADIYAVTQRPAESDKTALGNASIVHCGRLVIPRDRATMAQYLGVPVERVDALQPLEFLERDAHGRVRAGRVDPKTRA
jgi:hypothetical protein